MGDNQLSLAENTDEQYELALAQDAVPAQLIYSVPTVDVRLSRRIVYSDTDFLRSRSLPGKE